MSAPSTILVTGGAGFIGSHLCTELLDHGYELIVVDNYSNSAPQVFSRVERLAGRFAGAVYELDIRDRRALSAVFDRHAVDAVVHLAAHKAAEGSAHMPLEFYETNVGGTTTLLRTMHEHGVHQLVFSSTCSVYGNAGRGPLDETAPVRPAHPYAASKAACEQLLADVCRRRPEYSVVCLRYVDQAGAHPSGLLGTDPRSAPGHLIPRLAEVAAGRQERLQVFGSDHPTADGTAIRDYLHVMDTVEAHRVALDRLDDTPGMRVFNLGSGRGSSVLEAVAAFSEACGKPIPYDVTPRRLCDAAELVADATAVRRAWGWHPTRDLTDICRDTWRFQQLNPDGYENSARRPRHEVALPY